MVLLPTPKKEQEIKTLDDSSLSPVYNDVRGLLVLLGALPPVLVAVLLQRGQPETVHNDSSWRFKCIFDLVLQI